MALIGFAFLQSPAEQIIVIVYLEYVYIYLLLKSFAATAAVYTEPTCSASAHFLTNFDAHRTGFSRGLNLLGLDLVSCAPLRYSLLNRLVFHFWITASFELLFKLCSNQ